MLHALLVQVPRDAERIDVRAAEHRDPSPGASERRREIFEGREGFEVAVDLRERRGDAWPIDIGRPKLLHRRVDCVGLGVPARKFSSSVNVCTSGSRMRTPSTNSSDVGRIAPVAHLVVVDRLGWVAQEGESPDAARGSPGPATHAPRQDPGSRRRTRVCSPRRTQCRPSLARSAVAAPIRPS